MKKVLFFVLAFCALGFACGPGKRVVSQTTPAEVKKEVAVVTEEEVPAKKPEPVIEEKVEEKKEETKVLVDFDPAKDEIIEEVIEEGPVEAFNHNIWDNLLQKHVSDAGNVDYQGFRRDKVMLNVYLKELAENLPQDSWTREDKLAYWINVYNAYTVKLILDNYPVKSIKDIKNPWDIRFFKLGKKWYNLNEVEHQILRKMNEPRIHFAIVCASISCPKLENHAFTASKLEEQLTKATRGFLADHNRNVITEKNLKLSKIFRWFAKDFKQNGSLVSFLNDYVDIEIAKNARISYNDYDWNLNE
ncbi:DUF547 domain-containing protein [Leptobacterium flavescens]|uniref:DUF547 domain-containing protein n=1 Tax=Leptobacterium flavescens TaxID=472055 RepID=A0A6P0UN10_9FLAO|nr:DUF547 domain-containing protein [Leptobacterium flavescens]NER14761.1 DUF547 domain-containing protein [Leptobacterium flavescens]